MRKKLISTAVLGLALIFTSTSFAQTPFTQLDRFDKGLTYGISKTDFWYVSAWGGASIGNAKTGSEYTELLNSSKALELKGINVSGGGASIGLDFVSNKEGFSDEYGYDLTGCTDFEYDYKGDDHKICFQVKKSNYPSGGRVNPDLEYQYLDPYCRNISEEADHVEEISGQSGWHKVSMTLNSLSSSSSTFDATTQLQKVLQLQWRFESAISNGNLQVKNLKCIGKKIFMEPSVDITTEYGKAPGVLGTLADDDNYSWKETSSATAILSGSLCLGERVSCEGISWLEDKNGDKSYYKKLLATYEGAEGSITIGITKAEIAKPTVTSQDFTYDGESHSPTIAANATYYTIIGNSGTNADTYTAKVSLQPNDVVAAGLLSWKDGTTDQLYLEWTIKKAKITKPTLTAPDLTYKGIAQGPTIVTNAAYTITGNSETNAGIYTAKVALNDNANHEWADGSIEDLPLTWEIKKANAPTLVTANLSATYGQTLSALTLDPTSWAWVHPAAKVGDVANSPHTHAVQYIGDNNHNDGSGSVSVTVSKASTGISATNANVNISVAEAAAESESFDLNGINITLTNPEDEHGGLTFTLGSLTNSEGAVGTVSLDGHTLTFTKGTATIAGKTATQSITIASKNYNNITASVTITTTLDLPLDITVVEVNSYYYDGTAKKGYEGTLTATATGYTGTPVVKYYTGANKATATTTVPTNAGEWNVFIEPGQTGFFSNWAHSFTIHKQLAPVPTEAQLAFTATYGQTLGDLSLSALPTAGGKGTWSWASGNSTLVGSVSNTPHERELIYTVLPANTDNYANGDATAKITVTKAAGATVAAAPTVAGKTTNSITITAVTAPANEQEVEYGYSTSATGTPATWQVGTTFGSLSAGTTYYIFARAKENDNYNAGEKSAALAVTTSSAGGGGNYTPINTPKIASSNLNPIVRAMSGIIELQNLPKNAKVDVFNMQGKRIYSSNSVNSQVLKVQASAGMYIIRVASGSQVKVMRVSMR